MALGEFSLIKKYFADISYGDGIVTGVGDDAAVLEISPGRQLVSAVDTLVAGVHFPHSANPEAIAKRCLRVNLSDLAAMGATPKWFTLALTLPEPDQTWLSGFAKGLHEDAELFGCSLVGGDTTRGPLSISIAMMGEVDNNKALTRFGAKSGDYVFVTGPLGGAAAALSYLDNPVSHLTEWQQNLLQAYYFPQPRIREGQQLLGIASSAIDLSDGLMADLGHIAEQSNVAIQIDFSALPQSVSLEGNFQDQDIQQFVLAGGDDYELCFTVPENNLADLEERLKQGLQATQIGRVKNGSGVECLDEQGEVILLELKGYQHF